MNITEHNPTQLTSKPQRNLSQKQQQYPNPSKLALDALNVSQQDLTDEIKYLIGNIRDPQKPQTLLQLDIIQQDSVSISYLNISPSTCIPLVLIKIRPTVPHCHLTQQIGLAIRMKLKQELPQQWNRILKIKIVCREGSHNNAEQVEKQINDKERIAAALENQDICKFIKQLIAQKTY